jgi:hypothetical protein
VQSILFPAHFIYLYASFRALHFDIHASLFQTVIVEAIACF